MVNFLKNGCERKFSNSGMDAHYEMEGVLDADDKVFSVINVKVEFALKRIVYMHASLDAYLIVLTIPVCFVGDWHSVPSVRIYGSKPHTYTPNDTLGEYVRLKK